MTISQTIVKALAEREEVLPEELQPPLYEAVNPEALDSLLSDGHKFNGTISFSYKEYWVEVDATKTVPSVSIRNLGGYN